MFAKYISIIPLLLTASISSANEAHVHGLANLTLALEGNALAIQFESPADNLIGFEHKAKTEQEIQKIAQAKQVLSATGKVFTFNGTECKSEQVHIDVSDLLPTKHSHHDDYQHKYKHKHHHKHQHSSHAEISAEYQFKCQNPEALLSISFNTLTQFQGLQKVNVNWITTISQGATSLRKNQTLIKLK